MMVILVGRSPKKRKWDAASPADRRRGEAAPRVLKSGRDLAEHRGDDAAETGRDRSDDDERDERQDQAVLDGGLTLLVAGKVSQEAPEVVHKHVVIHPLLYADRFV